RRDGDDAGVPPASLQPPALGLEVGVRRRAEVGGPARGRRDRGGRRQAISRHHRRLGGDLMPYLAHDGVRLHYDLHGGPGDRPPLLLSHGFSASGRMWDLNVAALAGDREVLTWDLRGHARSDAPDDPAAYGVEQSVGDMVALLDVLGTTRVVLGGMSLGGYLSLVFHARHPDHVAALVLVDTGPGFRSDASREQWNGFAERTAQALERD